jgi:hypothetical protein
MGGQERDWLDALFYFTLFKSTLADWWTGPSPVQNLPYWVLVLRRLNYTVGSACGHLPLHDLHPLEIFHPWFLLPCVFILSISQPLRCNNLCTPWRKGTCCRWSMLETAPKSAKRYEGNYVEYFPASKFIFWQRFKSNWMWKFFWTSVHHVHVSCHSDVNNVFG